jgi:hypothetical protein
MCARPSHWLLSLAMRRQPSCCTGRATALSIHGASELLELAIRAKSRRVTCKPGDNIRHIVIVVSIAKPRLGSAPIFKGIATFTHGL